MWLTNFIRLKCSSSDDWSYAYVIMKIVRVSSEYHHSKYTNIKEQNLISCKGICKKKISAPWWAHPRIVSNTKPLMNSTFGINTKLLYMWWHYEFAIFDYKAMLLTTKLCLCKAFCCDLWIYCSYFISFQKQPTTCPRSANRNQRQCHVSYQKSCSDL